MRAAVMTATEHLSGGDHYQPLQPRSLPQSQPQQQGYPAASAWSTPVNDGPHRPQHQQHQRRQEGSEPRSSSSQQHWSQPWSQQGKQHQHQGNQQQQHQQQRGNSASLATPKFTPKQTPKQTPKHTPKQQESFLEMTSDEVKAAGVTLGDEWKST